MMRVLLIHTAGGEGSVALADTDAERRIVAAEVLPGRSSSERLVPAVRRLLGEFGWRLGELAAVVVVSGSPCAAFRFRALVRDRSCRCRES